MCSAIQLVRQVFQFISMRSGIYLSSQLATRYTIWNIYIYIYIYIFICRYVYSYVVIYLFFGKLAFISMAVDMVFKCILNIDNIFYN